MDRISLDLLDAGAGRIKRAELLIRIHGDACIWFGLKQETTPRGSATVG
jgi:hypothetical protein